MGYWVYKDHTTWTARVHDDNSSLASCKWTGALSGQTPPINWEHFNTLPATGTIEVWNKNHTRSKQVHLMACDHSQCMNSQL
jgi:hypothetical protein